MKLEPCTIIRKKQQNSNVNWLYTNFHFKCEMNFCFFHFLLPSVIIVSFSYASWTCFLWKPSNGAKQYWYPHLREEMGSWGNVPRQDVKAWACKECVQWWSCTVQPVNHATVSYVLMTELVMEITGEETSPIWVRTQVQQRREGQWQWGRDFSHTKKPQISKYIKDNGIQTSQYWAMKLKV